MGFHFNSVGVVWYNFAYVDFVVLTVITFVTWLLICLRLFCWCLVIAVSGWRGLLLWLFIVNLVVVIWGWLGCG